MSVQLGGIKENWSAQEVGDGNINYVWIIKGPSGAFVLKQAADFIRIVPTWRLTKKRVWWERRSFLEYFKYCPSRVPKQIFFNEQYSLNVMEYCHPHIILRKGLISGNIYPKLAEHVSEYLAQTLFHTSDLYLKSEEKRKLMMDFVDNSLIHLTESVIFHEPYITHQNNHWTNEQILHDEISSIQSDAFLKFEVSQLKEKFMNFTQALIHGDLHTGSIMVTNEDTKIIDTEFAFFGPMGFDIGAYLANLWLSYFSHQGLIKHGKEENTQYTKWLEDQAIQTWDSFVLKFVKLWEEEKKGEMYSFDTGLAQTKFIENLWQDTVGYAGCKMIRRIIGIAHVEDLESIKDTQIRADCEVKILKFAKHLILNRRTIPHMNYISSLLSTSM
uniref:S-methyl-5-thioribose kinase n=1 Tax=Arcella intermedia TaxID=1963864 RepID=A0A6B2L6L1_9EUKA